MLSLAHAVTAVPGVCDSAAGSAPSSPVTPTRLGRGEQVLPIHNGSVRRLHSSAPLRCAQQGPAVSWQRSGRLAGPGA